MKFSFIFIGIFMCVLMSASIKAQNADLSASNIKARINADGSLFWDPVAQTPMFAFPKPVPGSSNVLHTIYAAGLWLGGLDEEFGALHVAAQTYSQNGNDFWAGPIATNYNDSNYNTQYNRVWSVSRSEIDSHIAHYADATYVMPEVIEHWPAHGNIANGEAAFLAPFVDTNNNAHYDPAQGDYPDLRGDQAVYFIINDDRFLHTETGADKFKFEVHGMAYAFNNPDTYLYNNVFLNYRVINRSNYTYDTHMGMWVDFDNGQFLDDFVGCDSTLNLFYGYNGDSNDEGNYGNTPPAQGVVFLNHPMYSFAYYNNEFSVQGIPENYGDYYELLTGRWKDGSPFTYGSNGIGGDTPNRYMFSGDPATGSGWSEVSVGNTPSDRRGLGSIYPFSIAPNQVVCLDMAFPVARAAEGTPLAQLESVTMLKQQTQQIQSWYDAHYGVCATTLYSGIKNQVYGSKNVAIKVYPIPTNDVLHIELLNQTNCLATIQLHDLSGKLIEQKTYTLEQGKNKCQVSMAKQAAGVYLLTVTTSEGVQVQKITKW